jgi:ATP-dependent protease ClpP protease subunit
MPKDNQTVDFETNVVRFRTEAPKSKLAQSFEVKALSDDVHEVFLYGEIGWDISAKQFIEALQPFKAAGNTIRIRGNTPGGDVTEGYAIGNWIKEIEATVEFYVDGIAASIGSYIAACCDKVVMPKNSFQMIHRPWGIIAGNAEEMTARAEVLSKMAELMLETYEAKQKRTLGEVEDAESIRDIMFADDDSYLTAEECISLGLADELVDEIAMAACVRKDIAARFSASIPSELIVDDADAEPADEELSDADQEKIRAVCEAFDMSDRAEDFIVAKTSFDEVKKALWKAKVATDEKNETDPTPPLSETDGGDAYPSQRADKLNNQYAASLR